MRNRANSRSATLLMIMACAAILHAGLGCEDAQRRADKKVAQAIAQSQQAAMKAGGAAEAKRLLETAAAEEGASSATKARAKALLAQANYAEAIQRLPGLSACETKVLGLAGDIERLAAQIGANNLLIAECKGSNPAGISPDEPLKVLAANKAKYTAMAADADKRMAGMESQIRAKNADITALESNQKTAAGRADDATDKAGGAKGEAALQLFKDAAAARAQADNLAHAAGMEKGTLAKLQQLLAELKEQKKIALEGVAAADRQISELTKVWGQAQAAMSKLAAGSKGMAGEQFDLAGDTKLKCMGLAKAAKELAAAAASADQMRQDVDGLLQKAYGGYNAAKKEAGVVKQAMKQRLGENAGAAARPAWETMERLHSPGFYQLDEARTLMARGSLCAAQKSVLESEVRAFRAASAALKQAGLATPSELNLAAATQQLQAADKAARDHFKAADDALADIIDRGQPDEKRQAYAPRIAAQYALYGLTGAAANLETAKAMMKEMVSGEGEESGASASVIPVFPSDVEAGIVKRVVVSVSPGPVKPKPGPAVGPKGTGQEFRTWIKMMDRATGGLVPGPGGGNAPPVPAPGDGNAAPEAAPGDGNAAPAPAPRRRNALPVPAPGNDDPAPTPQN